MYYTFVMEPTTSGSTFTDETGAYHLYSYAGLCFVNSIVSLVTVPNITKYYDFLVNGGDQAAIGSASGDHDHDDDDKTTQTTEW